MFSKILVANRGEIAVRVIRTCKKMGIKTVSVYTEIDKGSLHEMLADEAVFLKDRRDYLNIDVLVGIAREKDCQAVHPGYGFLAENSGFAKRCREEGLVFIGPSPEAIEAMGLKIESRKLMAGSGVPVVPGSGIIDSIEQGLEEAADIGYPVLIKASAGGGGRGIRVAENAGELESLLPVARKEARTAFGNDIVYLERFFARPRHIEIQVVADSYGNIVHLGERECSIQRRRQKLLEESPSPAVDSELRARMGAAAVTSARAVGYTNCGTVEFLVDENNDFYFLEMNTRIQVEHPVTEMVTGVDMVEEQIRIAAKEILSLKQEDIVINGCSIECRLNAEDYRANFKPSPGIIGRFQPPLCPWTRMDTYVYEGFKVAPVYDSLLGKVIVWGRDRLEAIARMRAALDELKVEGIKTTAPLLRLLLDNEDFVRGEIHNSFLEKWMQELL